MDEFYTALSPFYHLIFADWNESMERQGEQLSAIVKKKWPQACTVLDASCGIGTQSIALSQQGFELTGSDLSKDAVERAKQEAERRAVDIRFSVCDMLDLSGHHREKYDIVLSADNSVPHLLNDQDILRALKQMYACLSAGGGCVITVRDYDQEKRGQHILKPYGTRIEDGKRYVVFQVWDFIGELYDVTLFLIEEDLSSREVVTNTMRTQYYAVSTDTLIELMIVAGFEDVRRIDDAFYQPVLTGTRPLGA